RSSPPTARSRRTTDAQDRGPGPTGPDGGSTARRTARPRRSAAAPPVADRDKAARAASRSQPVESDGPIPLASRRAAARPTLHRRSVAMVSMEELLHLMVQRGGSDLHLSVGAPPKIRIDGRLLDTEHDPLTQEVTKKLVYSVLAPDQVAKFEKNLELDFSFGVANLG